MAEEEPVRLVLTPEQREIVRRLSGQHVEAIELEPETPARMRRQRTNRQRKACSAFSGGFSAATGIPRQAWLPDEEDPKAKPDGA
jgi:hypothetical protein